MYHCSPVYCVVLIIVKLTVIQATETDLLPISRSSQCTETGVTKAVVCAILSGIMHKKEPLLLIRMSACSFLSRGFPLSLYEWSFTLYLDAI